MRAGSGEALVSVPAAQAFAYLADPRHAPRWFAGVESVAVPPGAPHAGMTWGFRQVRAGGRSIPMRMSVYEPATARFAWETTYPWPRDNIAWELRCEPTDGAPPTATRLSMTIRQRPGPLGWVGLLVAYPFARRAIPAQATRAAERARDALLALPLGAADAGGPPPRQGGGPRRTRRRPPPRRTRRD